VERGLIIKDLMHFFTPQEERERDERLMQLQNTLSDTPQGTKDEEQK